MRRAHGNTRPLSWWLLAAFSLLTWAVQAAPAPSGDPAQQQQKLEQLRKRISAVQARLTSTQGEQSQLNQKLEDSELRIGKLERRLHMLDGQLQLQEQRLDDLKQVEKQQQQVLGQQRTALRKQVEAAYIMGRQEKLKILLNQQDPARVSRMLVYYEYLNRARMARMQAIGERLDQLRQTQAKIAAQHHRLLAMRDQRTQQKQVLMQEQAARRKVIAALGQKIVSQGRKLTRLRGDEAQLQTLLRGLRKALDDIPEAPAGGRTFRQARGQLPWPVRGRIVHSFGQPKIGALRWDGDLIRAQSGRPVRAIFSGRVVFADWLRGFGLLLIIDHGDGYMTLYGHNQSLFKDVGDWVQTGEQVAAVGDTGGHAEAGVYFAIRKNGKAVNPARWCRRDRRGHAG